jgi:Subtilase family
MQSRTVLVGGVALLGTVAALSAAFAPQAWNLRQGARSASGAAHLVAFTGRSPSQRASADSASMDAALADLVRHAPRARPGHTLEDLHAMNPAARFRPADLDGQALVLIDAVTRGDAQQLKAALVGLGLEHPSVYSNDVSGWLPVARIADAAARPELAAIRASMMRPRATVSTQGDFAQRSSLVRANYASLDGTGVTVGVLSDSFDCYSVYAQPGSGVPVGGYTGYAFNGFTATAADDKASGALPSTVTVLAEPGTRNPTPRGNCLAYNSAGAPYFAPFGDEGRAILQLVHAVAPGAGLMFFTGDDGEANFANGIDALATAGAKVITDDIGYFDEPFYQDGIIAQAIDTAAGNGVAYFSAAGNNANSSWESLAPKFPTLATSGMNAGEMLLNFDTSGATTATSLPITIAPLFPGEFLGIVVEWDQPYVTGAAGSPGATSHIDLCVTGATGNYLIFDIDNNLVTCTGANASGVDPVQILVIGNPANASASTSQQVLNLVVGLAGGTPPPGRLIVSVQTNGQTNPAPISTFATHSETLQGHPGAAGAAAVGAAFFFQTPNCGATPALLEPFSSQGGAPTLFDTAGNRLATPVVRQKPDFVAPDGVNNTFLGFQIANNTIDGMVIGSNGLLPTGNPNCQNNPSYPNFFGTSAAAPHAAGIAALMLQANPAFTPAEIFQALRLSALPMPASGATPNYLSGFGFIQADAAFVVPTLTLTPNAIALGASSTLSWATVAAASCTASGDWSGAQIPNGNVPLSPGAAGVTNYTLTCTNATGATAASTVSLSTGAAPPAPTLSLSSTSIYLGTTATITWSDAFASSCTASGSWNVSLGPNGNQPVAPGAVGSYTYSLFCTTAAGPSATSSVTLEVLVPPPGTPVLSLGSSSITLGQSTTLTWSSSNAAGCTASGSWLGPEGPNGNKPLTPGAVGSDTYSLSCTNTSGTSPTSSVTLTVTAASSSSSGGSGGGGGGAFDMLSLGLLAGFGLIRRRKAKGCR